MPHHPKVDINFPAFAGTHHTRFLYRVVDSQRGIACGFDDGKLSTGLPIHSEKGL